MDTAMSAGQRAGVVMGTWLLVMVGAFVVLEPEGTLALAALGVVGLGTAWVGWRYWHREYLIDEYHNLTYVMRLALHPMTDESVAIYQDLYRQRDRVRQKLLKGHRMVIRV